MTITHVSGQSGRGTGTSSPISVTMASTPTNGNLLIAVIALRGSSSRTVSSITETNVTWTKIYAPSVYHSGSYYYDLEIWQGVVTASASTSVSVALSGSATAVVDIYEYSGVLTTSSTNLDTDANSSGSSTTASTGTTGTTKAPAELWIGGFNIYENSGSVTSVTGGFTLYDGALYNSTTICCFLEQIVSSTGTANSTTSITSNPWVGAVVCLYGVSQSISVSDASNAASDAITSRGIGLADASNAASDAASINTNATGSSVSTTTAQYGVCDSSQRKSFYANGLFWVFWYDGASGNILFATSSNGASWSGASTCCSHTMTSNTGGDFAVYFDGTYMHYAAGDDSTNNMYYRRGTPNSNGTITWSQSEQTVGTYAAALFDIVVDSNGYPWIGFTTENIVSGSYLPYVTESSTNDGTWSTASGFPYQLNSTASADNDWQIKLAALTSGKMFVEYSADDVNSGTLYANSWTGSAWNGQISNSSVSPNYDFTNCVPYGDTAYISWYGGTSPDFYIYVVEYTYSTNSFGSIMTVESDTTGTMNTNPVLAVDPSTGNLYCFWASYPTANYVYYKEYSGGSWGSLNTWLNETTNTITETWAVSCFTMALGGYIGVLYLTGSSSPYTIKFAYLYVGGATSINVSDASNTTVDALYSLAVALPIADASNAGADSVSPSAAIPVADMSNAGVDSFSSSAAIPSNDASNVAVDTMSSAAQIPVSDSSNAGADAVSPSAAIPVADASNLSVDSLSQISFPVSDASNVASDTFSASATISISDASNAGSDSFSGAASIPSSDVSNVTSDTVLPLATIPAADASNAAVDVSSSIANIPVSDASNVTADVTGVSVTFTLADASDLTVDSASVSGSGQVSVNDASSLSVDSIAITVTVNFADASNAAVDVVGLQTLLSLLDQSNVTADVAAILLKLQDSSVASDLASLIAQISASDASTSMEAAVLQVILSLLDASGVTVDAAQLSVLLQLYDVSTSSDQVKTGLSQLLIRLVTLRGNGAPVTLRGDGAPVVAE